MQTANELNPMGAAYLDLMKASMAAGGDRELLKLSLLSVIHQLLNEAPDWPSAAFIALVALHNNRQINAHITATQGALQQKGTPAASPAAAAPSSAALQ